MTHEEYEAWKAERYPLWNKLRSMGKWKGDYHYFAPDALRELIAKFTPPPKEEKPKAEAKKPKAKAEGNAEKLAELKAALEARIAEIKAA